MRAEKPDVLVTGASGFLGRVLVARLRAQGHQVAAIDLAPLPGDGVQRADVRQRHELAPFVPRGGWVLHLASVVGVAEVLRRPLEAWETSVHGTANVCALAAERGARVVFTSSSEVYGEGGGRPIAEDRPLPSSHGGWPRASYPAGKQEAERLVLDLVAQGGDGRIARLFNVAGPGQSAHGGMVVPTFVGCALALRPLPIIGDGGDVRTFQHVEDAVRGLVLLAASPEARGAVVNLGGSEALSVRALAARVLAVLGRRASLRRVSARQRYGGSTPGCRHRVPDTARARQLLGHVARLGIDDIVRDAAAHLLAPRSKSPRPEEQPCAASPAVLAS